MIDAQQNDARRPAGFRLADFGLVEAIAAFALLRLITPWAKEAAQAAGVTLPAMPLLQYTYLLFAAVLIVLAWVKLRGETWASFGLIWPKSWWRVVGLGVLLFVFIVVYSVVAQQAINDAVASFTGTSPNKARDMFGVIEGNLPLFLFLLPFVWLFAAFGEEVFYRGYLMTRFAQFMGETRMAWAVAVVAQAALFGAAHAYQGPVGMVGTGLIAVISGAATLLFRRNLWPAIIAHGLQDTLGFTLLYLGLYGRS
jgi:uncharacterized protein